MVQTRQKTEYSFIPIVINKYTARIYTWRNRVPQGALERLERLDAKVSRAVCAVRRFEIFLLQAGGTKEMFLSYQLT